MDEPELNNDTFNMWREANGGADLTVVNKRLHRYNHPPLVSIPLGCGRLTVEVSVFFTA